MDKVITGFMLALILSASLYFLYLNALSEEEFRVSCRNSGGTPLHIRNEGLKCFSNNIFVK